MTWWSEHSAVPRFVLAELAIRCRCVDRFVGSRVPSHVGIDPDWWTPRSFRQRCYRCPEHTHRIRPSFAVRWWIWFVPDVILTIFPASLSRLATPFAPGSPRLTGTRGDEGN